jgi:hypothetical protein
MFKALVVVTAAGADLVELEAEALTANEDRCMVIIFIILKRILNN